MPSATSPHPDSARRSPRERLLEAAGELFYAEGVQSVGIDRVIERAGVAKATLYNAFGNKDGLIRAYLEGRHESRRSRITEAVERYNTPRERLLAIFDALDASLADPGYNGCAFVNASAEARPSEPIGEAANQHRSWVRNLTTGLARDAGVPEPELLARQFVLLYDGAAISARIDHNPTAAAMARGAAIALLDAMTDQAHQV